MPRVAVIGRGSIGQRHAAVFTERLGQDAVAWFPAGVREATPVADIVEQILAFSPSHAVVATPAHRHLEFAQALMAHGVQCLIEKPLCAQAAEVDAWLPTIDANTPQPWVGYNLHYRPEYQFLRQQLPALGALRWAEFRCGQALEQWRPGRELSNSVTLRADWGGGVLRELSHEIEMALSLLGPLRVRSAVAQRGHFGGDVEEAVQAALETDDHCPVALAIDLYRAVPERRVWLVGEHGQLAVDFIQGKAHVQLQGEHTEVDFERIDSYGVQADRFLANDATPDCPQLADAVSTMALIADLEAAIHQE
ncbi:Gfo/Idh/MocA family protein [Saccharospirillum mangrovi]|uniref:Gfo/Idh/MocA family protein n=1 Tax=Saccharospirillum mangrovi TaxID=2161747 RepID=UPI000D39CE3B|nr:Gfo/Idh/MocA family oxidoreductase [Saccharospirillum mangrovi]